jgi:phosphatidylglycerophosphate synthase
VNQGTVLQRIAQNTNGFVTPANVLDAGAFFGAKWSGPRLDTWPGIVVGIVSYVSDIGDGKIARATGTSSHIGDLIDHIGDKPKIGYALYHIWTKRLADRPLVAAVAAYNAVTASITVYDRLSSGSLRVEVRTSGKRAMFTTATGVGIQTIGTKVDESRDRVGRLLRLCGALLGYSGLLIFGLPTIRQYWQMARMRRD